MLYAGLFDWWIATISWSIAFLIVVSVYLYRRRITTTTGMRRRFAWVRDFVFVWFLLGLLGFYIVTVNHASYLLFAIGNIVVEAMLIAYVLKSSSRSETP